MRDKPHDIGRKCLLAPPRLSRISPVVVVFHPVAPFDYRPMRLLAFHFTMLLLCLACSASVQASIISPPLGGGFNEEELLSSLEESKATTQVSSRSSQPRLEEKLPIRLNAFLGMFAASGSSGMSDNSSQTTSSGGRLAVAIAAAEIFLQGNAMAVWLNGSDWLALPSLPGGSLLKPPQVI